MAPSNPHASGSGAAWMAAMHRGDFRAAFAASDQVLRARDPAGRDDPALPYHERWVWDGRGLAGQDVLVRCYHGLGDTLQFCRYLPALRRVAARVTMEVQPALLGVLRQIPGIKLHGFDVAHPLKPAGCDVEVMELAQALDLPPDPAPYLRAVPLPGPAGRVGLCWQGGGWDAARDVPPALLRPLLSLPGLRGVCLQRGPGAAALPLEDPLHGDLDVADMAGLLAGLDAVVTVDTMIAHLAGALGRPVFLLLKRDADWRWGCPGAWYGSVRQYRQVIDDDWSEPLGRLAADLAGTLGSRKGL